MMKQASRKQTRPIKNSESTDSDCVVIDSTSPKRNINGLFIDLTGNSSLNENYEPPKKTIKLTKYNRIESPLISKRQEKESPKVLMSIDIQKNTPTSSKHQSATCSKYESPRSSSSIRSRNQSPKSSTSTNQKYQFPKSSTSVSSSTSSTSKSQSPKSSKADLVPETSQTVQKSRRESHSLIPTLLGMDLDTIPNMKPFECKICFETIEPGNGIILYECLHEFCNTCLAGLIEAAEEFEVKCPWDKCGEALREREIKSLVSAEVFEKHLQKSLKIAEHGNELSFHCRTPDCPVFMEILENVERFICPKCSKVNCIKCKAIHEGKSCKDYQEEINPQIKTNRLNSEIQQSEDAIKQMIEKNEAMLCPKCSIPVMKIDGCDFIKCTACKLGICWVTRKPRLDLKKADGTIIEGCKCGEPPSKKRCHPKCRFCH